MRLPRPQFSKLVGPHNTDPEVFGLRVVGYDGAVVVECADRRKLFQTLHAIEESVVPGDKHGIALHGSLHDLLWGKGRGFTLDRGRVEGLI